MDIDLFDLTVTDHSRFGCSDHCQLVYQFFYLHLLNDTDQGIDDDNPHKGDVLKLTGYQDQDSQEKVQKVKVRQCMIPDDLFIGLENIFSGLVYTPHVNLVFHFGFCQALINIRTVFQLFLRFQFGFFLRIGVHRDLHIRFLFRFLRLLFLFKWKMKASLFLFLLLIRSFFLVFFFRRPDCVGCLTLLFGRHRSFARLRAFIRWFFLLLLSESGKELLLLRCFLHSIVCRRFLFGGFF